MLLADFLIELKGFLKFIKFKHMDASYIQRYGVNTGYLNTSSAMGHYIRPRLLLKPWSDIEHHGGPRLLLSAELWHCVVIFFHR